MENETTSEDKTVQRLDKFFEMHVDDLEKSNLKDEFEYLKKSYIKLNKRYKRIIKQGDSEQYRSLKKEEASSENISKLKSHVISSVSKNRATNIKLKEDMTGKYKIMVDELSLKVLELEASSVKSTKALNRYYKENKKLLGIIDKKGLTFDLMLDKEIAQADMYSYEFSIIAIQIGNLKEVQNSLASQGLANNIIMSLERLFLRTIKEFDILHYEAGGLFYIIFFKNLKNSVDDIVKKLGADKNVSNMKLELDVGIAHSKKGKDKKLLLYEAMESVKKAAEAR
ncbi:MAG: hypothetical protein DRG78_09195 [Epsilonproteobacteria bacterium]|nr:MAG: hypothetical protein DRG78_09195 [Campylobacterota bacterium]